MTTDSVLDEPAAAPDAPPPAAPVTAAPPVGRTVGERLRRAREAKGWEIAEVSQRTRIPQRQLSALERDAYDEMPQTIFAVGFVKSYARELGLDQAEAAEQFRRENTRVIASPTMTNYELIEPDRVPSARLATWSAAAVALALVGGIAWYALRERAPETEVVAAGPDAALPTLAPPAPSGAASGLSAPGAGVPGAAASADTAAGVPAGVIVGGTAVTLTAKQDVWIQLTDRVSGQRVMAGILNSGQTYNVPAGDITLWTGRAGALEVRVGGRLMPPLGGEVETVKDVSLSAGALLGGAAAAAPIPDIGGRPPG